MPKRSNDELAAAIEALLAEPRVESPASSPFANMDDDGFREHGARLSEGGEPDERLVAVMEALAEDPDDRDLHEEERELLEWLGDDLAAMARDGEDSLTWCNGLLVSAAIGDVESCGDAAASFVKIVSAPTAHFLESLVLWGRLERVPAVIAAHGVPPTLTDLALLASIPHEEHAVMNLLRATSAQPPLPPGSVSVPGMLGDLRVACGRLNHLERLEISADFTSDNLASIGHAAWPKLRCLELRFGDEGCALEDLAPILEGKGLPAIEALALVGLSFADDVAAQLASAPLVQRITELDLSQGEMTDAGAHHLLAARSRLAHLERLDLGENFISKAVAASLVKALPNAIVDDQR